MSLAGVRSSRGDTYQVCIAFEWAIRMIKDASIAWIELDSTRLIAEDTSAPVDDIIIGWVGGKETCCQCKKNQLKFEAWSVDDLKDDLAKAADHLVASANATVRFYSRADFGNLGRLAERARQVPNVAAFNKGVPKNLQPDLRKLKEIWSDALKKSSNSLHDLLLRISFDPTRSVDDLPDHLKIDLGMVVTRVDDAYNVLWTTLDSLGARISGGSVIASSDRVTRGEILQLLYEKGCAIAPPAAQAEIESKLASMSRIGRGWRREIGKHRIHRPVVDSLVTMAESSAKILLTDGPGAGKTCVLLQLADQLEARGDLAVLFLQAREFADASDHLGRAELGLEPEIPSLVSAMSQWKRVVVVIDSLDVLSLSRESECLTFFLGLIDRLAAIPGVCVIAACRSFDLRFNQRLASRNWDQTVETGLLDWASVVEPLLKWLDIDVAKIDAATRALLVNPRNLALFTDITAKSQGKNVLSSQELIEAYLDVVVAEDADLGDKAMAAIEEMASEMLSSRRHQLPRSRVLVDETTLQHLLSANVLFKGERHEIGFGHQTLLDALSVRGAIRRGMTLLAFVQSLQPVPFVRPAIRAFFIHLRLSDRPAFRAQTRAVFDADVAFHIKRMIAESYGALEPEDDDWSLLRHLFRNHVAQFRSVFDSAVALCWHQFWVRNLVPLLESEGHVTWLEIYVNRAGAWANADPESVFALWTRFAASTQAVRSNLRRQFSFALRGFEHLAKVDAYPLLKLLVESPSERHFSLGGPLLAWAQHDTRGDELLWQYVVGDVPEHPKYVGEIDRVLKCDNENFRDLDAFASRISQSEVLLNLAVASLEEWSGRIAGRRVQAGPNREFLDETSFGVVHSNHALHHTTSVGTLVRAVEKAILLHAEAHDEWWTNSAARICLSDCGGLRHVGMLGVALRPDANAAVIRQFFEDERRLEIADPHELGNLIASSAMCLGESLALVDASHSSKVGAIPLRSSALRR
jgi:hypothetical protein